MKPKSPFYFVILFLLMETCPASPQEIFFNKVLPPEGKIFSHVSGITQDTQGYMWFATKKGLFKYDGYQMTSYNNNPDDSNSLENQREHCVERQMVLSLFLIVVNFHVNRF